MQLIPHLLPFFNATFDLNYHSKSWRLSTTVVLQKPDKPDYSLAKAYHPIVLLETIAKVLSSCVAVTLQYHTEQEGLLPNTHFGGWLGRTAIDALQMIMSFIKDAWRWKEVAMALFLDVKGAFPSVCVEKLVHNMRMRGVPKVIADWTYAKLKGWQMVIMFDGFTSRAQAIDDGCNQGDPLSVLYYLFYNADLVGISDGQKKELTIAYINDVTLLTSAKTFKQIHNMLCDMFSREGGASEWSKSHSSDFELDKLKMMGFTRWRRAHHFKKGKTTCEQRQLLHIWDTVVAPSQTHKLLGVVFDEELCFQEHNAYMVAKGTSWVCQLRQLSRPSMGMLMVRVQQLYKAVAISKMLYGCKLMNVPVRMKPGSKKKSGSMGYIKKLARV